MGLHLLTIGHISSIVTGNSSAQCLQSFSVLNLYRGRLIRLHNIHMKANINRDVTISFRRNFGSCCNGHLIGLNCESIPLRFAI